MSALYLTWQNPLTRRWFPIGRLTKSSDGFRFEYTGGVRDAQASGEFSPLPSFPKLDESYESEELFPLFSNRVLRSSRPDYREHLSWLGFEGSTEAEPLEMLARSGGRSVTDHLELVAVPEQTEDGSYMSRFFVHGLRHMPEAARERVESLNVGDRLYLLYDFQNPSDPSALAIRSPEQSHGDMHLLGYCPRYLFGDSFAVLVTDQGTPVITVARVNPPPAPVSFRILCEARFKLRDGRAPFSGEQFQSVPSAADPVPAR